MAINNTFDIINSNGPTPLENTLRHIFNDSLTVASILLQCKGVCAQRWTDIMYVNR